MTTITGTIFSVTSAIRLIPPITTSAATIISTIPVTQLGIPKVLFMLVDIVLIWVILPMPNDANRQNTQNITARTEPSTLQCFLEPSPCLR